MKRLPYKTIVQALLASFVVCMYFVVVAKLDRRDIPWLSFFLHPHMARGLLYGFLLFLGNVYLSKWVSDRYPSGRDFGKRMIVFYTGSIILTILVVFVVNAFFSGLFVADGPKSFSQRFVDFIYQQHVIYYFQITVTSLFISMVFFGFYFYKRFKDYQIKESQQEKQQISAQFASLKNQLDPHFLFNSLNVLNSLIEEDPKKASIFTTNLSRIYRYVLEHKDKSLVPLQEELTFSKAYLSLLSLRFEDGIDIHMELDEVAPQEQLLPLSLQLLIENVVKHNVISFKNPLLLRIYRKEDYLIVENKVQKKKVLHQQSGIGLKNITERYALLSDRPVNIWQNDKTFCVELPIIKTDLAI